MARPKRDENDKTANRKIDYSGLFALLKKNGMNKSDLVPLAGVTSNVVADISNGKQISMYAAVRLCEFFHVDFSQIMAMVYSPEDDMDFVYHMIVRLAKSTGRDYISIKRNGDHVDITDTFDDTPVCYFRVDLRPDYNIVDQPIMKKLEQITTVFTAIDTLKKDWDSTLDQSINPAPIVDI